MKKILFMASLLCIFSRDVFAVDQKRVQVKELMGNQFEFNQNTFLGDPFNDISSDKQIGKDEYVRNIYFNKRVYLDEKKKDQSPYCLIGTTKIIKKKAPDRMTAEAALDKEASQKHSVEIEANKRWTVSDAEIIEGRGLQFTMSSEGKTITFTCTPHLKEAFDTNNKLITAAKSKIIADALYTLNANHIQMSKNGKKLAPDEVASQFGSASSATQTHDGAAKK